MEKRRRGTIAEQGLWGIWEWEGENNKKNFLFLPCENFCDLIKVLNPYVFNALLRFLGEVSETWGHEKKITKKPHQHSLQHRLFPFKIEIEIEIRHQIGRAFCRWGSNSPEIGNRGFRVEIALTREKEGGTAICLISSRWRFCARSWKERKYTKWHSTESNSAYTEIGSVSEIIVLCPFSHVELASSAILQFDTKQA